MSTGWHRGVHGAEYDTVADLPRIPSGTRNAYRLAQFNGTAGSMAEPTWDRATHRHVCCDSRVHWRHRVSCPRLEGSLPPDGAGDWS